MLSIFALLIAVLMVVSSQPGEMRHAAILVVAGLATMITMSVFEFRAGWEFRLFVGVLLCFSLWLMGPVGMLIMLMSLAFGMYFAP